MKINLLENPYSRWSTDQIQNEIVELDCHIQDTENEPELNRVARLHKGLAEIALFERLL